MSEEQQQTPLITIGVIVNRNNTLDEFYLFQGTNNAEVVEQAETKFIGLCQSNVSNWDDYTQVEIDDILDEGHYANGRGTCIYICWPHEVNGE